MMTDRSDRDRLLDLLADHDAGLPVDPAVLDDPRARTVLDALASARAELAALPPVPVPPDVAARWGAALAGTGPDTADRRAPRPADPAPPGSPARGSQPSAGGVRPARGELDRPAAPPELDGGGAPGGPDHRPTGPAAPGTTAGSRTPPTPACDGPTDPATTSGGADRPSGARRAAAGRRPAGGTIPGAAADGPVDRRGPVRPGGWGSRRRPRPRPAVVAGLVLAVVLVVVGVVGTRPTPPSVTAAQLGGIARAAAGVHDAGALADPLRRAACLRSVVPLGISPDAPLAGSRTVVFDGHPGVILLLVTGELGVFRAVVVDPGCGPGGGTLLADTRVGG